MHRTGVESKLELATFLKSNVLIKYFTGIRKMQLKQLDFAVFNDIDNITNAGLLSRRIKEIGVHDLLEDIFCKKIFKMLNGFDIKFDHVGIEVFGPLTVYKNFLLDRILDGELNFSLFSSVQVYEILKKMHCDIEQVANLKVLSNTGVGLELFSCHQHYEHTVCRKYSHYGETPGQDSNSEISLRHLAFLVKDKAVIDRLISLTNKNNNLGVYLFGDGLYYNPGDQSSNIKLCINKKSKNIPINIIELIYHH